MKTEGLHVVRPRAAGLDVHKMEITATVRLCEGEGEPVVETCCFSTLPSGLEEMVAWLSGHGVEAAVMEGTGVYWQAPFEALEVGGIEAILVHARRVKQLKGRKTDVADSVWLACVCQFGLCTPSHVPPQPFRELRALSRQRRILVRQRSTVRNRVQKIIDRAGARIGGILSDDPRAADGGCCGLAADHRLLSDPGQKCGAVERRGSLAPDPGGSAEEVPRRPTTGPSTLAPTASGRADGLTIAPRNGNPERSTAGFRFNYQED